MIDIFASKKDRLERAGVVCYKSMINKEAVKICVSDLNIKYGVSLPESKRTSGKIPLISSNGVSDYVNVSNASNVITFGCRGTIGNVFYQEGKTYVLNTAFFVANYSNYGGLYFALKSDRGLTRYQSGAAQPQITLDAIKNANLYLPNNTSLNLILDLLSKYQKILTKLKDIKQQLLNKYF